jgi:hypothetical protein
MENEQEHDPFWRESSDSGGGGGNVVVVGTLDFRSCGVTDDSSATWPHARADSAKRPFSVSHFLEEMLLRRYRPSFLKERVETLDLSENHIGLEGAIQILTVLTATYHSDHDESRVVGLLPSSAFASLAVLNLGENWIGASAGGAAKKFKVLKEKKEKEAREKEAEKFALLLAALCSKISFHRLFINDNPIVGSRTFQRALKRAFKHRPNARCKLVL